MARAERTYAGIPISDRRETRRACFIEAGLAVFGGKGFRDSTITLICAEAGLARNHFYDLFANREALLITVYDHVQREAREAVVGALAATAGASLRTRVHAAVSAYASSVGEDRRRAAVAFVQIVGVSEVVEAHRVAERDVWRAFLAQEIRNQVGESYVPPGGYDLATTAVIGAMNAVVDRFATTTPQPSLGDVRDTLYALMDALT